MIDRYGDHAANERTMLAWVRTSLAVVAFGFLVEKFNLLLRLSGLAKADVASSARVAEWVGLAFMIAGIAILVLSLVRFVQTARAIDSGDIRRASRRTDIALFAMLAALLFAVSLFFSHSIGMMS